MMIRGIVRRPRFPEDKFSGSCGFAINHNAKDTPKPSQSQESSLLSHARRSWLDREQNADRHWLDRAFPGSREWLEAQNRKWWLRSVVCHANKSTHLQGRDEQVTKLVNEGYERFMAKHASKAVDDRAQTHLQVEIAIAGSTYVRRQLMFLANS
jgi:hypothetical protein